jgi:hypothetical protein
MGGPCPFILSNLPWPEKSSDVCAFDIVYVLSMVLFAVRFKLFFIVLSDASLLLCEIP